MRLLFSTLFLLLLQNSFGQVIDTGKQQRSTGTIKTFIKGAPDTGVVDIEFLRAGFELGVTDSSFVIKHFRMTWDDKRGDIRQIAVTGSRVNFTNKYYSLDNSNPRTLITFEDIAASKDGVEHRLAPFFIYTDDVLHRLLTIKNPQICHNQKHRLVCYNDGTYIFHFSKNRFTGFTTTDSLVAYDADNSSLTIGQTEFGNSPIMIQLQRNSVLIKTDSALILLDSIRNSELNFHGLKIHLNHSDGTGRDSIQFSVAEKDFLLEISTWWKRWSWQIVEQHNSSLFFITHDYRKNRPDGISLSDSTLKFGMSLFLRTRGRRLVRTLYSHYVEKEIQEDQWILKDFNADTGYSYWYNRFGKLKMTRSQGKLNCCSCQ